MTCPGCACDVPIVTASIGVCPGCLRTVTADGYATAADTLPLTLEQLDKLRAARKTLRKGRA